MIYFTPIIILAVTLLVRFILIKIESYLNYEYVCNIISISCVIFIIPFSIFVFMSNLVGKYEKITLNEEYKSIEYKYNLILSDNISEIRKKDYEDDIQEWNSMIIGNKELSRDFWVGIFIPNIYDNYETFDYVNNEER